MIYYSSICLKELRKNNNKNISQDSHKALADLTHAKPLRLVGFDVLVTVVMKSSTFWDITPCSPLKVN
jgi:hypothetical protein